jgi:hypothetical protein
MQLNNSQLITMGQWIRDNALNSSNEEQRDLLNALVSPAYFVWRTSVGKHEITDEPGIGDDGVTVTNFVFGGSQGGYIARSQGERDAWKELFNSTLTCKPYLANVRTAFDDIFSGSGAGAVGNRAHIKAKCRRECTVAEKLYVAATPGGGGTRGLRTNPDLLGPEGVVTLDNVVEALRLTE